MLRIIFFLVILCPVLMVGQTIDGTTYRPVGANLNIKGNAIVRDTAHFWDNVQMPYHNIYTVDSGGAADFTTTTAALAVAESGDAIRIMPGTYYEAISMKDGVDIFGTGQVTIKDPSTTAGLSVLEDNNIAVTCTIRNILFIDSVADGMHVQNSGTTVFLENVTVQNLRGQAQTNNGATVHGGRFIGGSNNAIGCSNQGTMYDCYCEATTAGVGLRNRAGARAERCIAYSESQTALQNEGTIVDCFAQNNSASNAAIFNNTAGIAYNCTGEGLQNAGFLNYNQANNCTGIGFDGAGFYNGNSGSPVASVAVDCKGISTSDEGFVGWQLSVSSNCTGLAYGGSAEEGVSIIGGVCNGCSGHSIGNSKFGMSVFNAAAFALGDYPGTLINCNAYSNDLHALTLQGNDNRIIGGNFISDYDNVAGYGISTSGAITGTILRDVHIHQANATASSINADNSITIDVSDLTFDNDPNSAITFTGNYTQRTSTQTVCRTLGDDASYDLIDATRLTGEIWVNDSGDEWGIFNGLQDGTPHLENSRGNVVETSIDGNLCLIDNGTNVRIQNRLGSEKTVCWTIKYRK